MKNQISFAVSATQAVIEDAEVVHADVALLLDNLPLTSGSPIVDVLSLLEQSTKEGDFSLFTCACGVPGCAGYHEDVFLSLERDFILWHVPSTGYRKHFTDKYEDGPWNFRFSTSLYRGALDKLKADLFALELHHGELALYGAGVHFKSDVRPLREVLPT
ncbi:hypothetical protein LC612_36615 [Nostoc sp. CHAB 5834]|nr:hypothetical protein [Nostoc sp. CHAB 5834]